MAEPISEEAWQAARLRAMGLIERGGHADLNEAITTYERLHAVAPRDTPIRAVLAAELCLALRLRFGHTRDSADLDAAVARPGSRAWRRRTHRSVRSFRGQPDRGPDAAQ